MNSTAQLIVITITTPVNIFTNNFYVGWDSKLPSTER